MFIKFFYPEVCLKQVKYLFHIFLFTFLLKVYKNLSKIETSTILLCSTYIKYKQMLLFCLHYNIKNNKFKFHPLLFEIIIILKRKTYNVLILYFYYFIVKITYSLYVDKLHRYIRLNFSL